MRRTARAARATAAIVITFGTAFAGDVGAGLASADAGAQFLPFAQTLRRCDYSKNPYVAAKGYGRATAEVRTEGPDVVADVQFVTAIPNSSYEVRLIQLPRSSAASCNPGDPGVAGAALHTDAAGAGTLTLRSPIVSGATGAWVYLFRPSSNSTVPEDFYTTDLIAKL